MLALLAQSAALALADDSTLGMSAVEIVRAVPGLNPELANEIENLFEELGAEQSANVLAALLNPTSPLVQMLPPAAATKLARMPDVLADVREQMQEAVGAQLDATGFSEVEPALDAGLVALEDFDLDPTQDDFGEHLIARLQRLLNDRSAYPLFDHGFRELVHSAVAEGALRAPRLPVRRATEVATAHDFLAKLPTFPLAKMDELIDVRAELSRPLIGFRSELVGLSRELGTSVLDPDFEEAATEAWRERVMPELQHLDELVEEKRLRRAFGLEASRGDLVAPTVVFAAGVITQDADMLAMTTLAGVGTAGISAAARAVQHRRDISRRIEASPYFFLHETDRRLQGQQGQRR